MMSGAELERFVQEWAKEAARHGASGDVLRLQQNENYWRRVMLAHVEDPAQRQSLTVLRRALVQKALGEEEVA